MIFGVKREMTIRLELVAGLRARFAASEGAPCSGYVYERPDHQEPYALLVPGPFGPNDWGPGLATLGLVIEETSRNRGKE
jgi:hypothetical protein